MAAPKSCITHGCTSPESQKEKRKHLVLATSSQLATSEGNNDTTEDGKQSGCPFCWQKIKCCACPGKNLANSNSVILLSIGARAVEQATI
ncbi:hypothetical protein AV530_018908 [Patagioenas fasciata monilis]|uniref:Uncharacterized protein n=1 Tax=Patagioenas fasciata monilis TaxID=372326 RepID=A0A1V4JJY4_PATFA|nr:hypothetical protein AV530_018908 [Patagioenas fasciata monilis]